MAKLVKFGVMTDLPPGKSATFEAEGRTIAVFNVAGNFFAIDDVCPHSGGPLSEGFVTGHKVSCPWHGADFDLKTGKVLCPPACEDVNAYQVVLEGDDIKVEI